MIYKVPAKFFAVSSSLGLSLLLALSMLVSITAIHPQNAHAATLPTYAYTKTFGLGDGATAQIDRITVDRDGNVVTAGGFYGEVAFGDGGGDVRDGGANGGTFVSKRNSAGGDIWTRTLETGEPAPNGAQAFVKGLTTDAQGNIYVSGSFYGTITFDGAGGSDTHTSAGGGVSTAGYLTKFFSDGSYGWTRVSNGSVQGVVADTLGHIYVTSSGMTFDEESEGFSLERFDAAGTYEGADTFQVGGYVFPTTSLAIDPHNNIYIAGKFNGLVDFGGGKTLDSGVDDDAFILKYGDSSAEWVKDFGMVTSVDAIYADAQNVYVAGYFSGPVTFDGEGGSDTLTGSLNGSHFVTKYSSDGAYGWTRIPYIENDEAGNNYSESAGVVTDSSGNVYVSGDFSGLVTFDGVGGSETFDGGLGGNAFVSKYASDGTYEWTKVFDIGESDYGEGTYDGSAAWPRIAMDASENIYLGGYFEGTVTFDGTGGSDTISTGDSGIRNAFLTKYSPAPANNNPGNPSAPNTGFGVFTTNPLRTLAIYSLVSLGLAALAIASRRFTK